MTPVRALRCERAKQTGVTLVELLVGLSIVAFAAALVVFNAPPPRPPARDLAQEMAARLLAARDAALLSGAAHRLEVIDGDYRIARYNGEDEWRVVHNWRTPAEDDVSLSISIDDPSEKNALALNGGGGTLAGFGAGFSDNSDAGAAREDKEQNADYVFLDPLGPSAAFQARFVGGRTVWMVDHSVMGQIKVGRE